MKRLLILVLLLSGGFSASPLTAQTEVLEEFINLGWQNPFLSMFEHDGQRYFLTKQQLKRFDAATENLELVGDLLPPSCNSTEGIAYKGIYFALGNRFFFKSCGSHFLDLSTGQIADLIDVNTAGDYLGVMDEYFVFWLKQDATIHIYRADPTSLDTTQLFSYPVLSNTGDPHHFTRVGNNFYFTYRVGSENQIQVSDGTAAGTLAVQQFPVPATFSFVMLYNGRKVVINTERQGGSEGDPYYYGKPLAYLDPADESLVLFSHPAGAPLRYIGTVENGGAFTDYYTRLNYTANPSLEIWKGDGSAAGAELAFSLPVPPPGNFAQIIPPLVRVADKLCFVARTEFLERELFCGDLDLQDVQKIDIHPTEGSTPRSLYVYEDHLYFSANYPYIGRTLMKSDGTVEGTVPVFDLGGDGNGETLGFTPFDDNLYFMATPGGWGLQVWRLMRTDGMPMVSGTDDETPPTPAVRIFPNPATESVELQLPVDDGAETRLEVFDARGRQVAARSLRGSKARVDLQERSTGLYYFKFSGETWVWLEKVLVAR